MVRVRESLELCYFIAQTVLAVIAIGALVYARIQVKEAKEMRAALLRQARATFLFDVHRNFTQPDVIQAVQLFAQMRREDIRTATKEAPQEDARRLAVDIFTKRLENMRSSQLQSDNDSYRILMRFMSFLEQIGVMEKRGFIPIEDIDDLFAGPVLDFDEFFGPHIEARQKSRESPRDCLKTHFF